MCKATILNLIFYFYIFNLFFVYYKTNEVEVINKNKGVNKKLLNFSLLFI